ncbi:MAG: hypothetical protein V4493_01555 [Pseudomonadota bacterium]
MMSREDLLRELELLPVWTLRTPQAIADIKPVSVQIATVVPVDEAVSIAVDEDVAAPISTESVPQTSQVFKHIASEDGDWLFVLPNIELLADEALLLRNILMAMRIKAKPVEMPTETAEVLNLTQPKLVVAMGEAAAQYLLQSTASLTQLRGSVHTWQHLAFVVTYDLGHLLQTLPDKAKAWDDLCLAMQTLQRLKIVS